MKKKVVKFTFLGIVLFLGIYLIFFILNGKSNPDTGITNCSVLSTPGEYYFLSGNILNNQITDNCINISAQNITLDCQGHYIYSIQNYSGVYSNSINTTIKNCNITMGSGANANAFGIHFSGSNRGTIFNNNISGDSSAGIYLSSSNNNNITNNNVTSISGAGIYIYSSSYNNLTSNIGTSNSSAGIYIYSSSNNILTSNTGTDNVGYGIYIYSSSNNILTSNTGIGNGGFGIYLYFSNNNILTSNTGMGNTFVGINIRVSSNNNLTSNLGISNLNPGIWLFGSSNNNRLISNTGISNLNPGIYLSQNPSNNLLISNIGISNSSQGIAVSMYSNNNILTSNTGISNSSAGFYVSGSVNNILTNSISNNNIYGLYLSYSNGTIVTNLTAKNNSLYGIYLEGGSYYNIIKNSFIQSNNGSAFVLNNSVNSLKNNSFYNNYFNNSIAFSNFSASSINYFNTTKTAGTNIIGGNYLGGNYWAAPNGTGFSQTCTDEGDGICNTSYNLDGINFDYLPLVCHENWICNWGTCINNIQTRICIDSNLCQTYNFKPAEDGTTQSCGTTDTGENTASIQGNGGTSFTQSIQNITPNKPVGITINNSRIDLSSLTINVKKSISNSSVNIIRLNSTASDSIGGLPIGKVYQEFEINSGIDNSNIINATINFKIDKAWLAENNIILYSKGNTSWLVQNDIVGNVILYRNPQGVKAWLPLTTNFFSEDNQSYYFSAYSPGFSTFAIFLNKYDCLPNSARCFNNEVQSCLGNSTWFVTEHCSDTCGNGKCTSSFFKSDQFYFLIIIGIIAFISIGIIIFIYIKRKIRKEKRKIRMEVRRRRKLKRKR